MVNLNETHTLEDLKKVAQKVKEILGYEAIQMAVHLDEGHFNEDGEFKTNFHGHIVFCQLDKDGKSLKRKNTYSTLQRLQTEVADILGMQRGEFDSKAVRLEHREFRAKKEEETKKIQPLKKQIKALKTELAEAKKEAKERLRAQGAKRTDYAKFEAEIREIIQILDAQDVVLAAQKIQKLKLFEKVVEDVQNNVLDPNIGLLLKLQREVIAKQTDRIQELERVVEAQSVQIEKLTDTLQKYMPTGADIMKQLKNIKINTDEWGVK